MEDKSLIKVDQLEKWDWPQLVAAGLEARLLKDKAQWFLGYLALRVETKYGQESIKKFADEIHTDPKSLVVYRWVASKFPSVAPRLEENLLPFRTYQIAAGTSDPDGWIRKAEDCSWTSNVLAKQVKDLEPIDESHKHDYEFVERCRICGKIKLPEEPRPAVVNSHIN